MASQQQLPAVSLNFVFAFTFELKKVLQRGYQVRGPILGGEKEINLHLTHPHPHPRLAAFTPQRELDEPKVSRG
jgi:hypothetical protein